MPKPKANAKVTSRKSGGAPAHVPAKKAAARPAGRPAKAAARPARRAPAATIKFGPRKDLGAPVDGFFARQPPHLSPILAELRAMIAAAAPSATSTIKWGMPFYSMGGNTLCALAAFKAHVNLILPGPPGTYADPGGLLEGDGKTGKHLKIRTLAELPGTAVRGWLKTAAARAES